jgi:hypothetical protein
MLPWFPLYKRNQRCCCFFWWCFAALIFLPFLNHFLSESFFQICFSCYFTCLISHASSFLTKQICVIRNKTYLIIEFMFSKFSW